MSVFISEKYQYWEAHALYIWNIRNDAIDPQLFTIIDTRAYELLLILSKLANNPNIEFNADEFDYVPASYEDLTAVAMIFSQLPIASKITILNRSIQLEP
jgi:hypothetical protein